MTIFWSLTQTTKDEDYFVRKRDIKTKIAIDSDNATSIIVNTLTVRGSHETSLHACKFLTLITLHTDQRHLTRDLKGYNNHLQQCLGGCYRKKLNITALMTKIKPWS